MLATMKRHISPFNQVVADNFNGPDVYETMCMPDLHAAFSEVHVLSFADMPGPITAEQVKERLGSTRHALLVIVPKWEQSGQGEGAERDMNDPSFGHLDDSIKTTCGDQRSAFLNGNAEHVLYYWALMESQDILGKVLSIVKAGVVSASHKPAAEVSGGEEINSKRKAAKEKLLREEEEAKEAKKFGSTCEHGTQPGL